MHVHFLTHITSAVEIEKLPQLRSAIETHFPGSTLTLINQSGLPISQDHITAENTKALGYAWTLRFLQIAKSFVGPNDLLIKIDPDTMILGNPLVEVPNGSCFGQLKQVHGTRTFLGGFQGYTAGAIATILEKGHTYANETGAQDRTAYRIIDELGIPFVSLGLMDLWAEHSNFPLNSRVLHWRN